jgi:hypothetical protein
MKDKAIAEDQLTNNIFPTVESVSLKFMVDESSN